MSSGGHPDRGSIRHRYVKLKEKRNERYFVFCKRSGVLVALHNLAQNRCGKPNHKMIFLLGALANTIAALAKFGLVVLV